MAWRHRYISHLGDLVVTRLSVGGGAIIAHRSVGVICCAVLFCRRPRLDNGPEADVLGDRIGIMVEGQLKAEGTSNALKAQFGAGYRVVAERKEPRRAAGGGGSLEPNAQPLMESAGHASAEAATEGSGEGGEPAEPKRVSINLPADGNAGGADVDDEAAEAANLVKLDAMLAEASRRNVKSRGRTVRIGITTGLPPL